MNRINEVFQKAQETIGKLLDDPKKYVEFLNTAANNYSYSFLNQILIYANKPQTKAVATYEEWNRKYKRYVNRGAKSFYILDSRNKKSGAGVKRVIDYSDTNRYDKEELYFWQINEENRQAMERILSEHGYLKPENGEIRRLTEQIKEAAAWFELDLDTVDDRLYRYVRTSVYTLLMVRTDPERISHIEDHISMSDFDHIKELGEGGIRLIGDQIKTYVYEIFEEMRSRDKEIRQNRTKENTQDIADGKRSENKGPDKDVRGEHSPQNNNFIIEDDTLGRGGRKERYRRNTAAVSVLKKIEKEGRTAEEEEKKILSQYTGWGGIPEVFDSEDPAWRNEYEELKGMLSADEYRDAKESVLSAFYTQPVIIRAIYKALDRYGYTEGNILEPSCGIGNFFGMLPEKMNRSRLYGVEIDSITGRIAKQLYPDAEIFVDGYENINFPDEFFDIAVGNVPFGQYSVSDHKYDKHSFLIHDYYFAKTLDKVRKGGIIAFITSKGTLDKKRNDVRRYIAERAEFLGAIRLPSDAFKQNARTEAVADIIFLKKREAPIDHHAISEEEREWLYLGCNADGLIMNEYFVHHPEMIMGTPRMVSGRFGQTLDIKSKEDQDLETQLGSAVHDLQKYTITEKQAEPEENTITEDVIPARPEIRNNSYAVIKDELYYRQNDVMIRVADKPQTVIPKIRSMVVLRDHLRKVINLQVNNATDEEVADAQSPCTGGGRDQCGDQKDGISERIYRNAWGQGRRDQKRKCFERY